MENHVLRIKVQPVLAFLTSSILPVDTYIRINFPEITQPVSAHGSAGFFKSIVRKTPKDHLHESGHADTGSQLHPNDLQMEKSDDYINPQTSDN